MNKDGTIRQIILPERDFWKNVFCFAIPIALQNLSVALFGIIDVSIISNMGEVAVSAVSLANEVFYVASVVTFGIASGASVLLSRNYGAGNHGEFKKSFAAMVFICILVNSLVMILSFAVPERLLALYTDEKAVMEAGVIYLIITAPTNVCYGIAYSIATFFRSVYKPAVPMIVSLVTVMIKTGLNVVLIYGMGPIPEMGVTGAAIATLLAKILEMVLYIIFLLRFREKKYCFRLADFRRLNRGVLGVYLKETAPVIITESMWGLGISSYNMIFGRMGVVAVSAVSVAQKLESLCYAFYQGLGVGACVTISSIIGRNKREEAKLTAKRYVVVVLEVGLLIMLLMLCCNHVYVDTFFKSLTVETRTVSKYLIAVYALYMPFRSLGSLLIIGVLRAGGDSKYAMYCDVLSMYAWALSVGFLLGIVFKLPITVVVTAMMFKRVIKCVFALKRFFSGKWLKI